MVHFARKTYELNYSFDYFHINRSRRN